MDEQGGNSGMDAEEKKKAETAKDERSRQKKVDSDVRTNRRKCRRRWTDHEDNRGNTDGWKYKKKT